MAVDLSVSGFEDANQVGMGKRGGASPKRKLLLGVGVRTGRHQLDCGFPASAIGEKNRAVVRGTKPLPEGKLSADGAAFPLFGANCGGHQCVHAQHIL
jgi:hypothetical protein